MCSLCLFVSRWGQQAACQSIPHMRKTRWGHGFRYYTAHAPHHKGFASDGPVIDSYISEDCCNSCVCVMLVQFMSVYLHVCTTCTLLTLAGSESDRVEVDFTVKVRSSHALVLQYCISLNASPMGIVSLECSRMHEQSKCNTYE